MASFSAFEASSVTNIRAPSPLILGRYPETDYHRLRNFSGLTLNTFITRLASAFRKLTSVKSSPLLPPVSFVKEFLAPGLSGVNEPLSCLAVTPSPICYGLSSAPVSLHWLSCLYLGISGVGRFNCSSADHDSGGARWGLGGLYKKPFGRWVFRSSTASLSIILHTLSFSRLLQLLTFFSTKVISKCLALSFFSPSSAA